MRLVGADFNAITEAGHVRLTLPCSQEDILRLGLGVGGWAWLSDGELIVGAQLAVEDRYGLVGVIDWDTLVHLDDEGANDLDLISRELHELLIKEPHSKTDNARMFGLLTQLERIEPNAGADWPQPPSFRRAFALRQMGKFRLALLEVEDARETHPDDPMVLFLQLELLRLEDLPAAVAMVEKIVESPTVTALVLAACINILGTQAEQAATNLVPPVAERVYDLCQRLEEARDREQLAPSLLALAHFNRGIVLLRAGQVSKARGEFECANQLYPEGRILDSPAALETYDLHTREVARRVRAIAEQWVPPIQVAA
jgi:tetratricopeptide (TPR) repeat protein